MSKNQFISVEYRIRSCLFGNRIYRVTSKEDDFPRSLLEEILDQNRQTPGNSYMVVQPVGRIKSLIMVPFHADRPQLDTFLSAMDDVMANHMGTPGFVFPQDVAAEGNLYGYLFSFDHLHRDSPLRELMPAVHGPRWNAAISLFQRVKELKRMGLTSNGLTREQLRYNPESGDVRLLINHTLSHVTVSENPSLITRQRGFLTLPDWTESECQNKGIVVDGIHRDLFSAAVAAFYMLTCGHPFIGQAFTRIDRESYLNFYHSTPRYVMEPGSANALAVSDLDELTKELFAQMVPPLQALFSDIFMAVTHPAEHWAENSGCWDPEQWIHALTLDKEKNDIATNRPEPLFDRWVYHLV